MSALHRILFAVAAALVAAPTAVSAASLSVVTVTAPDINCVFNPTCTIVVTDSAGDIVLPGMSGKAILQSRTFTSASGAPAEGKNGYEYRIDLTQATSAVDASCVTDLTIDFGPVVQFQYNKVGPKDDVYVVTKGGLGTIGLLSADQNGSKITFTFDQPVCAGARGVKGDTTFFFGLAANGKPTDIIATVGSPGFGPTDVKARAPVH